MVEWLPQSQPLLTDYSALSNPNGYQVTLCSVAQQLLAAKGYHDRFVLMFLVSTLGKPLMKEENVGWMVWKGVGLVTDQKVLENVFKGRHDSWVTAQESYVPERIDR